MNWIKVPVRFVKEGQPDYGDLGIKIDQDVEPGFMLVNMDYVHTINASENGEETILRFDGATGENSLWVQLNFSVFEDMLINGKD